MKELFLAKEAEMTPDGLFYARGGLAVLLLGDDGATNGLARGVSGVYVRSNNTARCDGPVRLDLYTKNVRLEGTNMTWNSAQTLLTIEQSAVLTLWRGGASAVEALQK